VRIQGIEVMHIKVPLKKIYKLSKVVGTVEYTEPIIIRLHTDKGIVGIGETDSLAPFTEETPETVKSVLENYLKPKIIGMNPMNIVRIHKEMDKIVKGNYLAKAAIDIACHDILGKAAFLPVYYLLGGLLREEIPIAGSLGADTPENNAREALEYKARGIKTLMIKTGSLPLEEDIERVKAVRKAVGKDVHLIVDANQGWDVAEAIQFGKAVSKYDIDFIEQPVPYWDIEGLAKVRRSLSIPISADESLFTIHDARILIKKSAVDIFSIKVVKHGGIYKAKQIIELANAFNIKCWMNSMIEEGITQAASLHLGVSSLNILEDMGHAYSSPLRLKEDITDYSEQIQPQMTVKVNRKPGLGVMIKEEVLQRYMKESLELN